MTARKGKSGPLIIVLSFLLGMTAGRTVEYNYGRRPEPVIEVNLIDVAKAINDMSRRLDDIQKELPKPVLRDPLDY